MNNQQDLAKFCEAAKKLGASEAVIIKAEDIVVSDWPRFKCRYGCPCYNRYLTCPPYSPKAEETRKVTNEYKWAILFKLKFSPSMQEEGEAASRLPPSGMPNAFKVATELEKQLFLAGYDHAFGMGAGPCLYCETCTREPGNCRFPDLARPAMEACGIDVLATARKAGFKPKIATSKADEVEIYGLVLVT